METFALYLIKSTVWLTGFFLIYMLFLRNERFFVLNRIYLVTGILVSIVFPLFSWHYTVIFPVTPTTEVLEPQVLGVATVNEPFPIQNLLLYFYLTGALFLFFRLIKQTVSVWKVIRNSETHHFNSVKLIRTDRYPASFSFFSFVFVNPSIDETETNEIVNHEQEHIRQQHWMDLLLFEILRTMHWFNPVSWLYGRLIRQNHEYLADERALQRSSNPAIYRAALLNQMFGGPVISLANSFNYSLNKRRFNMMKQKTYSPIRKLRLLLVLPLIAGVFYAFATPEYKFVQTGDSSETVNQAQDRKIVKGKIVNDEGQPLKGANIVISGTSIGTISDASGNFELKMTDESPLLVTYVGYGTRRIKPDFSKEMVIQTGRITVGIDSDGTKTIASDPSFLSSPPLFVVDGKEITKSEMEKIDPDKIESIDVIKNKEFTKKYGEKGKDGVVLITLKKDEQTSQTFKVQSNSPLKFGDANSFGKQPLIIVDGVIEMQDVNNIPPETIESINVLKKESLTKIYGDKGKNGVILITTKKGASTSQNTPIDVKVTGYANNQNENTSTNTGVKIRSTGTSGKPLMVVDGIISENKKVEDFDPETIESINVLKNETATQKYGERGKDGVLEITMKKSENTFISVEEMPEFPGGTEAINPFIKANLRYPKKAEATGITGKVFVDFTITKTGKVENVKISKGLQPLLDEEALRVIRLMPDWKPGAQNGEKVEVKYQLSVSFNNPNFKQKEN